MRFWVRFAGLVAVVLAAGSAVGQTTEDTRDTEKNIRVLQQKSFMKQMRVEVVPTFTLALNETLTSHMGVGALARFHFLDDWAVGLEYTKYFGKMSRLATTIGDDFGVYPEKRLMDFFIGGHATWAPVTGKFLLFGGPLVHWDTFVLLGGGVTHTGRSAYRPSGAFGAGMRFAILRFLTVNFEARDILYPEKYNSGTKIVNNIVFMAGVGVFAPFSHEYQYPK